MAPRIHGSAIAGITLIELLVVMVIIGILAAIAFPSYTAYVRRSDRSDATRALMVDAQMLQRCYSQNFAYTGGNAPCPATTGVTSSSPQGYYTITITVPDASATNPAPSYAITAAPASGSPQNADSACASFTLESNGVQSAANSGGTDNTQTCWGSR